MFHPSLDLPQPQPQPTEGPKQADWRQVHRVVQHRQVIIQSGQSAQYRQKCGSPGDCQNPAIGEPEENGLNHRKTRGEWRFTLW